MLTKNQKGSIGCSPTRKRVSIVMHGVNSFTDWYNDLDMTLVPLTNLTGCSAPIDVKITHGIHNPWAAVHDDVIHLVRGLIESHPEWDLEVTGHALGGSLSYLAFIALMQNFPNTKVVGDSLATFPIGNDAFARFGTSLILGKNVFSRGTNGGDGVPFSFRSSLTFL
jgi:hypothetical protein